MTALRGPGRLLAVALAWGSLIVTAPSAEETAPGTQQSKPSSPREQGAKPQESKPPEPPPPELRQERNAIAPATEPPPNIPNRSLILTVKLALLADQRTAPYRIEVDTNGEGAVLSGKVSNDSEKRASEEVARRVEGIKSIVNKLEVVPELRNNITQRQDQTITEYVKERFKKSATLEAAGFGIKTENGVVELSGRTRFQVIVLEAAEAARQVPGVKAVKTHDVRIEIPD